MERAVGEQRDLERAANYVQSLLAQPIDEGPLRTEWMFRPSARLGGDAFGCDRLDGQTFAVYLFDVCGHGIGAAMHSVSCSMCCDSAHCRERTSGILARCSPA